MKKLEEVEAWIEEQLVPYKKSLRPYADGSTAEVFLPDLCLKLEKRGCQSESAFWWVISLDTGKLFEEYPIYCPDQRNRSPGYQYGLSPPRHD